MKKLNVTKKLLLIIVAAIGLFGLVAMKPLYKNFPPQGKFELGPIEINPPHWGPDDPIVYTVVNNSKCKDLKVQLAFTPVQKDYEASTLVQLPDLFESSIIRESDIRTYAEGIPGININEPFRLTKGGLFIQNLAGKNYGSLIPGERNKKVAILQENGEFSTEPCFCFILDWDEKTKTITISDCE